MLLLAAHFFLPLLLHALLIQLLLAFLLLRPLLLLDVAALLLLLPLLLSAIGLRTVLRPLLLFLFLFFPRILIRCPAAATSIRARSIPEAKTEL